MSLQRIRSVIFWSVITAAFIGPGTVTTAAKAGAGFGFALLWALLFSILATVVLQEAAARVTLGSGKSLGEIVALQYEEKGRWIAWMLFGAIVLGCGAYQAGNLLGAFAGMELMGIANNKWLLVLGLLAGVLLWSGSFKAITSVMAVIVAAMGLTFCWVALGGEFAAAEVTKGLVPSINDESALLVIGLIGTTIVPYNLFLASGLSKGQTLSDMRWGLVGAIIIGGLITLAIMITGTQIVGDFSFANLADAISERMGNHGDSLLAIGLLAAGFSSAITAPLAAAVTGKTLFESQAKGWDTTGKNFRLTWGLVLAAGLLFALTGVKPIPAIIAAQAVNGIILPLIAFFLVMAVNNNDVLPPEYRNNTWLNVVSLLIVGIAVFLGVNNILLALGKLEIERLILSESTRYGINIAIAFGSTLFLAAKVLTKQQK